MSGITLTNPDLGLYADFAATRITVAEMIRADRTETHDETRVWFDGDTDPVAYRGTHRERSISVQVRVGQSQHGTLAAIYSLFESARTAADGRIMLRTNRGQVDGLDPIEVVSVPTWSDSRLDGLVYDLSFTAYRVHYEAEV